MASSPVARRAGVAPWIRGIVRTTLRRARGPSSHRPNIAELSRSRVRPNARSHPPGRSVPPGVSAGAARLRVAVRGAARGRHPQHGRGRTRHPGAAPRRPAPDRLRRPGPVARADHDRRSIRRWSPRPSVVRDLRRNHGSRRSPRRPHVPNREPARRGGGAELPRPRGSRARYRGAAPGSAVRGRHTCGARGTAGVPRATAAAGVRGRGEAVPGVHRADRAGWADRRAEPAHERADRRSPDRLYPACSRRSATLAPRATIPRAVRPRSPTRSAAGPRSSSRGAPPCRSTSSCGPWTA